MSNVVSFIHAVGKFCRQHTFDSFLSFSKKIGFNNHAIHEISAISRKHSVIKTNQSPCYGIRPVQRVVVPVYPSTIAISENTVRGLALAMLNK